MPEYTRNPATGKMTAKPETDAAAAIHSENEERNRRMYDDHHAGIAASKRHKRAAAETERREKARERRLASRPREVVEIDRHLDNCERILTALAMVDPAKPKPGDLRRKFESLALADGAIQASETGIEYWTAGRLRFASASDFQLTFGFPGDPAACRETFGLSGHLFADTIHDANSVAEYVTAHRAEIEARRAEFARQNTRLDRGTLSGRGNDGISLPPTWS